MQNQSFRARARLVVALAIATTATLGCGSNTGDDAQLSDEINASGARVAMWDRTTSIVCSATSRWNYAEDGKDCNLGTKVGESGHAKGLGTATLSPDRQSLCIVFFGAFPSRSAEENQFCLRGDGASFLLPPKDADDLSGGHASVKDGEAHVDIAVEVETADHCAWANVICKGAQKL